MNIVILKNFLKTKSLLQTVKINNLKVNNNFNFNNKTKTASTEIKKHP